MKIVVLNGSPKGNNSITLQYIRFLEIKYPKHTFQVFHIAHDINKIETDGSLFKEIISTIQESDGIVWAFPLYYLLVSAQYKRFIELIWERNVAGTFKDKYTVAISTSIHFFDHTAHNYIHAICDDLGMNFLGSYSADMYDLIKESEQKRLLQFSKNFLDGIAKGIVTPREYPPIRLHQFHYEPKAQPNPIDSGGRQVLILTDCTQDETNLVRMVEKFKGSFDHRVNVAYLSGIEIKGGCLGCIRCGYNNTCIYDGKDEFASFFNETLKKASIVVFAGTIKDRYLSSIWKMFFDRSFFNNHSPYLVGKQIGFLISGPLNQIPNLRQILEGYIQLHRGSLAGMVSDDSGDSSEIDKLIEGLAYRLIQYATTGNIAPFTFLGIGGHKILRDEIYGHMRFPFQADHAFYKKSGYYDFPQKDLKTRATSVLLMLLTKIPAMRREIYQRRMITEMVKPLKEIVDKAA